MTAIVGILCQQGVVIGTDSSVTFSAGRTRTIEQPSEKLHIIENQIIVAGTGQVGLGQRFQVIVKKAWDDGVFNNSANNIVRYLSRSAIEDYSYTFAGREQYGALMAFPAEGTFHLCEFALADFQPEFKTNILWYVSLGVTQHITDSFLALMREIFWASGPPALSEGIFAATWALDHAVEVNPGGVNLPIRIASLERNNGGLKAEILPDFTLDEHRQNIEGAKEALRKYCLNLQRPPDETTPDIPRPT